MPFKWCDDVNSERHDRLVRIILFKTNCIKILQNKNAHPWISIISNNINARIKVKS